MRWFDEQPISVEHVLELPEAPDCRVLSATVYVTTYSIPHLQRMFEGLGRHVLDEPASWVFRCCNDYPVITWFNFDEQKLYVAGPDTCPRRGRCRVSRILFFWMLAQLADDELLPVEEE